jgi:flagellar protein FlaI
MSQQTSKTDQSGPSFEEGDHGADDEGTIGDDSTSEASGSDALNGAVDYSPLRDDIRPLLESDRHELVEEYWLEAPFSFAAIFKNQATGEELYRVVEPDLNEGEAHLYEKLKHTLRDQLLFREELTESDDREEVLVERVHEEIENLPGLSPDPGSLQKVIYYLRRDLTGYERIQPFMFDPALEEISCNGTGEEKPLFVYHREYDNIETNIRYQEDQLRPFVQKLAQRSGKDISTANPAQGTSLPDGSRVQLTLDEISPDGESFTIRKFREDPFTPVDLINYETFSTEQMAYLWLLIENGYSGLISGGTGAGKTSTLNALALFAPPAEKIITIEDTREVKIPQKNYVSTLTREGFSKGNEDAGVDMFDLLKSALRMRPEYLIVGEVRGEEAYNMFQAMNTGHTTYATIHADSMQSVLSRLKSEPMNIPKNLIAEIGFISIQTTAEVDGEKVRRSQGLYEITELDAETGQLRYKPTYEWNSATDEIIQQSGSTIIQELEEKGLSPHEKFSNRKRVLEYLIENDITDYEPVSKVVRAFMRSPEMVLDQMDAGQIDFEALAALEEQGVSTNE